MKISPYIGHPSQLTCVEEHRLVGGRGDGMRLIEIRNACGMEITISADRCGDISRLIYKGRSLSYFSPCGYVAPQYYDGAGDGFLKSFTAGFFTTCGLTAVGSPCTDDGESLPLHGSIGNTPCERIYWEEDDEEICIHAFINDSGLFSRKLRLEREIICRKFENKLSIIDRISNHSDTPSPLLLLYHMNMGYPLLSENSVVEINSNSVMPRNEHAAEGISQWNKMLPPTAGFEEQCYYHRFEKEAAASIYNPDINTGLEIRFDPKQLDTLTQWKMMGVHDYVLGLEPGNCTPDGRDVLRREGRLKFIAPDEEKIFRIDVSVFEK